VVWQLKSIGNFGIHPKHPATPLGKLLKSAINNWEQKNEGASAADADLVVKTIFVDGAEF
jgi:large subunit ribosomal protein L22